MDWKGRLNMTRSAAQILVAEQSPTQGRPATTPFMTAHLRRRTQYSLGRRLPMPVEEIIALIKAVMRHTPSTYNSQSSRALILFGKESDRFWDITRETLRKMVPEDKFASTDARMTAFAAGIGTVLFFEDQETVRSLEDKYPLYAEKFPEFSEQSSGMAQLAVWTALAEAGLGASLQHYNPLVDVAVAETWGVPASWKLRAQMPFGSNEKSFAEKTFVPDEGRFIVAQ
jgi:predicted oxidoreductase (fatty acid repression mutant protein)